MISHGGIPSYPRKMDDRDLVLKQLWWRLGIPHDLRNLQMLVKETWMNGWWMSTLERSKRLSCMEIQFFQQLQAVGRDLQLQKCWSHLLHRPAYVSRGWFKYKGLVNARSFPSSSGSLAYVAQMLLHSLDNVHSFLWTIWVLNFPTRVCFFSCGVSPNSDVLWFFS